MGTSTTVLPIEGIFVDIVVGITDDGGEPAISFGVQNPFIGTTDMYVEYIDADTHNSLCLGDSSVEECNQVDVSGPFNAVCTPGNEGPFTVVTVWFVDKDEDQNLFEDSATVKECCQPTDTGLATARYTFALPCECIETARKLRGGTYEEKH